MWRDKSGGTRTNGGTLKFSDTFSVDHFYYLPKTQNSPSKESLVFTPCQEGPYPPLPPCQHSRTTSTGETQPSRDQQRDTPKVTGYGPVPPFVPLKSRPTVYLEDLSGTGPPKLRTQGRYREGGKMSLLKSGNANVRQGHSSGLEGYTSSNRPGPRNHRVSKDNTGPPSLPTGHLDSSALDPGVSPR